MLGHVPWTSLFYNAGNPHISLIQQIFVKTPLVTKIRRRAKRRIGPKLHLNKFGGFIFQNTERLLILNSEKHDSNSGSSATLSDVSAAAVSSTTERMGHGCAPLIWLGHTRTDCVYSTSICYLDPFWISKQRATPVTCAVMNFYAPSVGSSTTIGPCTCSSHLNTRRSLRVEELLHPSSNVIHGCQPWTINHPLSTIHHEPSSEEDDFPYFQWVPSEESCPSWRCRSWPFCSAKPWAHQMRWGLWLVDCMTLYHCRLYLCFQFFSALHQLKMKRLLKRECALTITKTC